MEEGERGTTLYRGVVAEEVGMTTYSGPHFPPEVITGVETTCVHWAEEDGGLV